jgi:hypothetical protein
MQYRSPSDWAEICRIQANLTSNHRTREALLAMAAEHEAKASLSGGLADALFHDEPVGTFIDGYVFPSGQDLSGAQRHGDSGDWSCEIDNRSRLTWSDKVYELFGLRAGAPVEREWAVARYSERSRSILDRVRTYALRRDFGFILDALIEPATGRSRWIRVLAVPTFDERGPVRLHGVKRPL